MLLLASGHAGSAGAAGSVQGPATRAAATNPVPPGGATATNLPRASLDQFTLAERRAIGAAPQGTPGIARIGASLPTTGEAAARAFGTSAAPYTTARVAVTVLGSSSSALNTPVTSYPYRPTGKLYFKIGADNYICSASLIAKGVLVTAAHCVFEFGQRDRGWHTSFVFCPANTTSSGGPYGCYNASLPRILTTYFDGTDVCTQSGVVCNNDIATLLVTPKSGTYVGSRVGWYNYSWNGYSYRASSFLGNVTTVQVTQLGYPKAFDSGYQMQRTDAVGWYFASGNLKNTQIGSAQTGGTSGGPWLANFGTVPSLSSDASLGSATTQTIVGVSSYGSTRIGYNRMGSSYFGQNSQYNGTYGQYGAGNIGLLVRDTCTSNAPYC